MKRNMGTIDRIIRLLVVTVVLILYFNNVISDTFAIFLLILAGIFVITNLVSFCPLYLPFGLNTGKNKLK